MKRVLLAILALAITWWLYGRMVKEIPPEAERIWAEVKKLKPSHTPLGKPQPGDWLASRHESGQTFREYVSSNPVVPAGRRQICYIQPIGEFTPKQQQIIELTADFMGRYFNLQVKVNGALPDSVVPASARRMHPSWDVPQILTSYVLHEVLKPRLPDDAAVLLAFTASDLWPGKGWNFVFGQASLRDRVGVWSIYRNGDPEESEPSFDLCLLRTLKTATHETGHMFSMKHCIKYKCNMCGSNHREESDRQPILLCPECQAKICWALKINPVQRYRKLSEFFGNNDFPQQHAFCEQAIRILTHNNKSAP